MILSVVIPAHNESDCIRQILIEIEKIISECRGISQHEIIVVDDHSSDNTFTIIKKLSRKNIKAIRLSRRSGSHVALRAGLLMVKGDAVFCLSADGQDDPSVLPRMLNKLAQGKNVIWAVRKNRDEPFMQKFFARIFYMMLTFFTENINPDIDLSNADYYMIDKKVIGAINSCPERNTSLFGLIIWLGFEQDFVNYDRRARLSGKSRWDYRGRLRLAMDWIIAFSGVPLQIIIVLGLFFSIMGMFYTIFIFVYVFLGYARPGWAEPVVLILVTSGVQMTMLGIIGEYLWRSLDETRKRPLFFVENQT